MADITKDDVYYSLLRLQEYIRHLPDEEFQDFVRGRRPIFTAFMAPRFQLLESDIERDYRRSLTRLEFRIS